MASSSNTDNNSNTTPPVLHLIEKARAAQQAYENRRNVQLSFYECPELKEEEDEKQS